MRMAKKRVMYVPVDRTFRFLLLTPCLLISLVLVETLSLAPTPYLDSEVFPATCIHINRLLFSPLHTYIFIRRTFYSQNMLFEFFLTWTSLYILASCCAFWSLLFFSFFRASSSFCAAAAISTSCLHERKHLNQSLSFHIASIFFFQPDFESRFPFPLSALPPWSAIFCFVSVPW